MRTKQQIDDMNSYIKNIEKSNDEVRRYRHDMKNIFMSLHTAVKNKDIESVTEIYEKVVKKVSDGLDGSTEFTQNASYVKNEALKSIVINKIFLAQSANIDIIVSLIEPIDEVYIEDQDYIRIVSILLDNAIEAAQLTDDPYVAFTFTYKKDIVNNVDTLIFVVKNNFLPDYIASTSTKELFKDGVTSNKNGRGIGLSNIEELQQKYSKINSTWKPKSKTIFLAKQSLLQNKKRKLLERT